MNIVSRQVIYILIILIVLCVMSIFYFLIQKDDNSQHIVPLKKQEDRRRDKTRLSIVEFNVEWLFSRYNGGIKIGCPGKDCPWKSEKQAKEHISRIASILNQLDADIIHLNEVQDIHTLEILNNATKYKNEYEIYLVAGEDKITGQNVAMLSRIDPLTPFSRYNLERVEFPVPGSKCKENNILEQYDSKSTSGVSKHYRTRFRIPLDSGSYLEWIMIGLHLLAFPNDPGRCFQREAQAMAINLAIKKELALNSCDNLIIIGDLNDFDHRVIVSKNEKIISRASFDNIYD